MRESANSTGATGNSGQVAARIFRVMAIAATMAAAISVPFATWRVATGLLLGGGLSLLNFHWMRNSITAAFGQAARGTRPQIRMAQYVLRYFVIGLVVYGAYKLDIVSLTATLVGLCTFVVALFAEAIREFYLVIINREEIS